MPLAWLELEYHYATFSNLYHFQSGMDPGAPHSHNTLQYYIYLCSAKGMPYSPKYIDFAPILLYNI